QGDRRSPGRRASRLLLVVPRRGARGAGASGRSGPCDRPQRAHREGAAHARHRARRRPPRPGRRRRHRRGVSARNAPRPCTTQLRVGRLLKAHGLKGALKVELYTDEPEKRFVPGAVFSLQVPTSSPWHGKTLELAEFRWYNTQPVAFFTGV